jgi:hypothetical protein
MNDQEILKWILLALLGGFVWFLKNTIIQLKADVEMIKSNYLHKNDFKDFKIELREMIDEIKISIKDLKP